MKSFLPGTVFNAYKGPVSRVNSFNNYISISYPTRLESMVLDPSKISIKDDHKYNAGQINFKVNLFTHVSAKIIQSEDRIHISKRPILVRHAIELFRKATKTNFNYYIEVLKDLDIKHAGLGSSSNIISAVFFCLNALHNFPLEKKHIIRYLAQNHAEEAEDDRYIVKVQGLGGSSAAGFYSGGLQILSGFSSLVYSQDIDEEYDVVFGVPKNYEQINAETLISKEIKNIENFVKTGQKHSKEIAYRLLHQSLPSLVSENNLRVLGKLIFDYRFKMGSIRNCSFVFPQMMQIADNLKHLFLEKHCEVLTISSVGPGFFSMSKGEENREKIKKDMSNAGLIYYELKPYNQAAKIIKHE